MPRVVLFKTPTTTNGSDSYQESFTRAGCGVTYIPVLQETFHLDQLTRIILDGNPTWGGIVITSKRGAEAWIQAASTSEEDHSSE
jgi:uroporphyrinogen-III synthase